MKTQNFTIVISFFCIWLTGYFSQQIQLVSAFLLIITFGILHGSNDIVLLNKINEKTVSYSITRLLSSYLFVVLSTVVLFYYVPALALLVFVMISSFHFGEQHWNKKIKLKNNLFQKTYEFIYGFFILLLLFNFQPIEVQKVIFEIGKIEVSVPLLFTSIGIVGSLLFILSLYLFKTEKQFRKIAFLEGFYLIVFSVIFKMSTLIWGFAIYFIFWHSIPSLIDQVKFLHGTWNKTNFMLYCKSAFWYWMVSIAGIAILYFTLGKKELFEGLFFAFLAAITFPHVMVIITMNNNKQSQKKN